jgi:hypothetical protein
VSYLTTALQLLGQTSGSSFIVPARKIIDRVIVTNNNGNAITGGLKFGTTNGGIDVVAALAVAGNSISVISDATLLKRLFSRTLDQAIFFDTVTLWNSANVDIYVYLVDL